MQFLFRPFLLSLFAVVCSSPAVSGDVLLLSQPTVTDAADVGLGFFSSSHPRPTRNFKRGDDFILAQESLLTRVCWWGQSEGRVFDDLRNFDQYTIEFFEGVPASGGPLPGALVWSGVFNASSLSISATGRTSPISGAAEHLYEAAVPELHLDANTAYIIAISARSLNTQGDAWQWQDGEFFGGHGASYSYASRAWTSFEDTDSAFELVGTVVPSPAGAIACTAMIALSARRRRSASDSLA